MIARRAFLSGAAVAICARAVGAQMTGSAMTPATEMEWTYLADTVMGGVSQGAAQIEGGAVRLTGTVSTANNGGFVQVRTSVASLPAGTEALRLRVRGNSERYFIHLRTTRTLLPWQYYQAGFETRAEWSEVTLPFASFAPSGRMMSGRLRPENVRSIGLVAFGRDHVADVSLAALAAI